MRERGSKGEDQKAESAILSATSRGNGTVYQRGTGRLCEKRNRMLEKSRIGEGQMDYLEQRRKLRQMVQERLDYGRDYTDEEVEGYD